MTSQPAHAHLAQSDLAQSQPAPARALLSPPLGGRPIALRPTVAGWAPAAAGFRSRLDDYLMRLMRGDLAGAVEAHFAPEGRLFENGALRASGAEAIVRKLAPVVRRFAMLRGTLDDLVCDRAAATACFRLRFDGVEVDGRLVREEVTFRQRWHHGRIVEEHQDRPAGGPAASADRQRLVAGAAAVL